jgi:hypothetical protein
MNAFIIKEKDGGRCPRGTPAEIVQRLNQEINAAFGDPAIKGA